MPKKTLSGTGERIRIDKSTDAGIVISALEVVEPGISVVVVAAVANGIDLADGVLVGAGDGKDVAPGVVLVLTKGCAQIAHDPDHIALLVQNIVVSTTLVHAGIGKTVGIIDDLEDMLRGTLCPGLADDLAVQGVVMIGNTVDGLAVPDAGHVVGVGDGLTIAGCGDKLPALLPTESPAGAVVVADRVAAYGGSVDNGTSRIQTLTLIGKWLAIIGGQKIPPIEIRIGIGVGRAVFGGCADISLRTIINKAIEPVYRIQILFRCINNNKMELILFHVVFY